MAVGERETNSTTREFKMLAKLRALALPSAIAGYMTTISGNPWFFLRHTSAAHAPLLFVGGLAADTAQVSSRPETCTVRCTLFAEAE